MMFVSHKKHKASTAFYEDNLTLLYVSNDGTLQETRVSTDCYLDSFTSLYVDHVCTSQESHL
jgi:hypothetical protein